MYATPGEPTTHSGNAWAQKLAKSSMGETQNSMQSGKAVVSCERRLRNMGSSRSPGYDPVGGGPL